MAVSFPIPLKDEFDRNCENVVSIFYVIFLHKSVFIHNYIYG